MKNYKCNYDQRHRWKLELDLVGILKNVPKGTKLYSPVCGECELDKIILPDSECAWIGCRLSSNHSEIVWFSSNGIYAGYENGECMIFPSKYNRNWATFKISKV